MSSQVVDLYIAFSFEFSNTKFDRWVLPSSMPKFIRPQLSLLFTFPSVLFLPFSLSHQFSHSSSSSNSYFPHSLPSFQLKTGLEFEIPANDDILQSHFINGQIPFSQSLLEFLLKTNIGFLNSTIRRLSADGSSSEILNIYRLVRISGANPDNYTYPYVLKACADLKAFEECRSIHAQILKCGYGPHPYVANSLIDMYAKLGLVWSAHQVFDEMTSWNLVSWNSIISAYGLNGFPDVAIELCNSMRSRGMRLDRVGLKIVLPACGLLKAIRLGKSAHAHLITSGLITNAVLATAVIDMYMRCSELNVAKRIFYAIPFKDVVSWNAMISGLLRIGELRMVLEFFHRMQVDATVSPNIVTVLVALQACADFAVLQTGECIHGYVVRFGLSSDVSVAALLIDMYSKCGLLSSASCVFDGISRGTVNSWSAMIHGLGMHGNGEAALMCFFRMLKSGIDPDEVCFLLVLSCCSHNRLVNEGCKMFEYMVRQFGIHPRMEHYATMVDVFGRAGLIDEAFRVICCIPTEPDIDVWGAFLGACRIHDDFKIGEAVGEQLIKVDPRLAGYYKLLLGIYAGKGRWDEVGKIRRLMEEREVKSISGCSLIEMKN